MAAPRKRAAMSGLIQQHGEALARQRAPNTEHPEEADRGEAPTNADIVSEAPTNADKRGDTLTIADDIELVRVSGRIAKRQRDELERIARREGRLLSELLREAIRQYLEAHE